MNNSAKSVAAKYLFVPSLDCIVHVCVYKSIYMQVASYIYIGIIYIRDGYMQVAIAIAMASFDA